MRQVIVLLALLAVTYAAAAQQDHSDSLVRLGYPGMAKLLIIHADDLGMSHSVNAATFEALQKGWVTSASIMAPCPWFAEAAEFARQHHAYDFGLHLTLTSEWKNYRWSPVSPHISSSLVDSEGYLPVDSSQVAKRANIDDVEREILDQIAKAEAAGIKLSHLDNHMGALSQRADLFQLYGRVARKAGIPRAVGRGEVLAYSNQVPADEQEILPIYIEPASDDDRLEGFRKTLRTLKPGVYIYIVHLGHDDEELRAIMLGDAGGAIARQNDFDLVSNPRFHQLLKDNGIQLISWRNIASATRR